MKVLKEVFPWNPKKPYFSKKIVLFRTNHVESSP